jgi:hypothetical protein
MSIGKETRSGDVENYSLKIPERYFTPMARETHHKIETSEIALTEDIIKITSQLAGLRAFNSAKICYDWGETSLLKHWKANISSYKLSVKSLLYCSY